MTHTRESPELPGRFTYFDCQSFVYGVLDAYLKVRDSIPARKRACFPADMAPWQALVAADGLVATEKSSLSAASAIIDVLRKKYPCK
jgi:hypothetical protein